MKMKFSAYILLLLVVFFVRSISVTGQETSGFISHNVKSEVNLDTNSSHYNIQMDSIRKWNQHDSVTASAGNKFLQIYSESVGNQSTSSGFNKVKLYFNKSNYLFRIILFLNLFFLGSVIIMLFIILNRRLLESYIAFKRNKCQDRYRDFITEWLYAERAPSVPGSLLHELKDPVNRDVFTSELISLHANLTGDSAAKLGELFHMAGLEKYTIRKVIHSSWHLKAKGFRELAQMKIKEGNHLITKYLNSPNAILRIEAQLAWIQLNPDDPLSFFDDPNVELTEWGLLNTLPALKKIDTVPNFGRWLQSPNKSVALSALRMVGIFKQFGNVGLVTQRLGDSDPEIRREAICAIGKMAVPSPGSELQQMFPNEETGNKTEILHAMIMISENSFIPFFKYQLLNETDIGLRILSARGLIFLGANGRDILDSLYNEDDAVLKKIIIHAKDERI